MSSSAHVRTLAVKEARALLPLWLGCVLMAAIAAIADGSADDLAAAAFGTGMIALGAYSMGHEYVHRTVGAMLSLPVGRQRVFLVKLAVLSAMVLPLAVYASAADLFAEAPEIPPWLVATGALTIVPAMTMVSRNAIAGALFSAWIAIMLLIGVMVSLAGSWDVPRHVELAAFAVWQRLMAVVLMAAAALGWLVFRRLEWIETGVEFSVLSRATTSRAAVPGHPLLTLLKKEIRLQRMAFGVATLYLVASAADAVLRVVWPHNVPFVIPATLGYALCLPVLIGSVASAEERHLGTIDWQRLLPVRAWHQWAVKAGVVFGLALVLGVALPALVLQVAAFNPWSASRMAYLRSATVQAMVLAAVGLYFSSLCRNALIAVAMSFGALAALLWISAVRELTVPWNAKATLAAMAAAVAFSLRFGFVNHRVD